jgi:hypothetical protein
VRYRLAASTAPAATFTPPAAAFTPPASTSAVSLARHHGARFVHYHCPTHQIAAVASFDGVVRSSVIVDFDESKAAGFSSKSVAHHVHAVHGDPGLRKEIRYIGLRRRIREVPDE